MNHKQTKKKNKYNKKQYKNRPVFDTKWKNNNIKLLKNNTLAVADGKGWEGMGRICGKNEYFEGVHDIKIKIKNFPTPPNQQNRIWVGIIDVKMRHNFFQKSKRRIRDTYYFQNTWNHLQLDKPKLSCDSYGESDGRRYKHYGTPLKSGDILTVHLNMENKTVSFSKNEQNFGIAWENIPQIVCVFVELRSQKDEDQKNEIQFL
ncbi:spry domain-containing socs box protein [Anaeramoeba flamelloides]|uniref:Spry domain-containing socs box protein n=1 Tax=Anaeramoeba flamelloides TaxID=1746091 RepID=A0AAV7Y5M4_9EUKA|nr:spry domain-containing socs box protein [Anaeramoeba flamelloides]